jgi:hypothetical protein
LLNLLCAVTRLGAGRLQHFDELRSGAYLIYVTAQGTIEAYPVPEVQACTRD